MQQRHVGIVRKQRTYAIPTYVCHGVIGTALTMRQSVMFLRCFVSGRVRWRPMTRVTRLCLGSGMRARVPITEDMVHIQH